MRSGPASGSRPSAIVVPAAVGVVVVAAARREHRDACPQHHAHAGRLADELPSSGTHPFPCCVGVPGRTVDGLLRARARMSRYSLEIR